ncbi:MAG: hypothetical protein AAFP84_04265 [Actinomycetota bacterium]
MNVDASSLAPASDAPLAELAGCRARRTRRGVAVAVVGLLALTACTSDPGPKRVAEDIIKAEAFSNPDLDEECLLAELEKFSDDDLRQIESDLSASNSDSNDRGEAALVAYQRSLEACN